MTGPALTPTPQRCSGRGERRAVSSSSSGSASGAGRGAEWRRRGGWCTGWMGWWCNATAKSKRPTGYGGCATPWGPGRATPPPPPQQSPPLDAHWLLRVDDDTGPQPGGGLSARTVRTALYPVPALSVVSSFALSGCCGWPVGYEPGGLLKLSSRPVPLPLLHPPPTFNLPPPPLLLTSPSPFPLPPIHSFPHPIHLSIGLDRGESEFPPTTLRRPLRRLART